MVLTVNKLSSLVTLFCLGLLLSIAVSVYPVMAVAPEKLPLIDKNMQLAMLNLTQDTLESQGVISTKSIIETNKAALKATPKLTFSNNCLSWNATQLNAKADQYKTYINTYAKQYSVDVNLIKSVITAESCFKPKALSSAGAQGLMQLIPDTAKRFGVTDSYDPKQNIRAGIEYLNFLLGRYKGDLKKAIAGYNAGEGAVDRYKGIPPYKETQRYVKNVLKVYGVLTAANHRNDQNKEKTVKKVYQPPKLGQKPGRHGWQYNRRLAPHLFKKMN